MNRSEREADSREQTLPYVISLIVVPGEGRWRGIVIVEDEIQVPMLAESVLQRAGHDTVSACTVAEAQALINSKDEKFELVFADIELGNHKEGGLTTGKLVGGARSGVRVLTHADAWQLTG